MTLATPTRQTPVWPVILFVIVAVAYALMQAGPAFSGDLRGSDDMMRLQQVRDLIAGQGWYDVDQSRLLTQEGGAMHWSRLPDIFLAAIILLTQPLVGRELAEGLAVTIWPVIQLCWALTALAACLRRLEAPISGQLAGIFFFCTSAAMVNFMPGRIDHHGLGIALTLTAFACLVSPRMTTRSAVIAALCVAAMITIAIENLPVVGLTIVGFGSAWLLGGTIEAHRLRVFGATLIVATLLAYIADAPGAGGIRTVCDAYGQSHFVALLVAATGLAAIATVMPTTRDWRTRLLAMAIAGGVTVVSFVLINPSCVGSPYAALPEGVRDGWLNVVAEARPLPSVFADDAGLALFFYGTALAGLISAGVAMYLANANKKREHFALLLVLFIMCLIMVWQLRAASLAHALAAMASGWLFGYLFSNWKEKRGAGPASALLAAALFVSPTGWNLVRQAMPNGAADFREEAAECRTGEAYRQIAAAPRMSVFTPIDLGAPLIYYTRHYATAAPYHRNPSGIEGALDVFKGPTNEARSAITATGATHLLFCPRLGELQKYANAAPNGFAADLLAGRIPNWLVPLTRSPEGEEGPVVYTVAFDRN